MSATANDYRAYLRPKGLNPPPCPHTRKRPGEVIVTARGPVIVEKAA